VVVHVGVVVVGGVLVDLDGDGNVDVYATFDVSDRMTPKRMSPKTSKVA
jgi:hypothetical protein